MTQRLNDTMTQRRLRTLKLVIEYDGTNYLGWQVQPRGPTIQGILEEKLALLTGQRTQVTASGRTDAGVHALNQVAHFRTESEMDIRSLQRALNSLLPPDILIKKIEEVEGSFPRPKECQEQDLRLPDSQPPSSLFFPPDHGLAYSTEAEPEGDEKGDVSTFWENTISPLFALWVHPRAQRHEQFCVPSGRGGGTGSSGLRSKLQGS